MNSEQVLPVSLKKWLMTMVFVIWVIFFSFFFLLSQGRTNAVLFGSLIIPVIQIWVIGWGSTTVLGRVGVACMILALCGLFLFLYILFLSIVPLKVDVDFMLHLLMGIVMLMYPTGISGSFIFDCHHKLVNVRLTKDKEGLK